MLQSLGLVLRRAANGVRRIAAGLPPSEEAVWPGVCNDLFVAHQSVYSFAAELASGLRVLDAACGTGYGSDLLAARGARSVIGIDNSPRRIRYATSHFQRPGLRFDVQDCTSLQFPPQSFDLIVSSNTLEHIETPHIFLGSAAELLTSSGRLLVTVPPVLSEADLLVHARNRFHVAPLSVQAWADLFTTAGWSYRFFTQWCSADLDFGSPYPSRVSPLDFTFEESSISQAYERAPLSVTYLLWRSACRTGGTVSVRAAMR